MQSAMVALCLLPQSHVPSREAGSFDGPEAARKRVAKELGKGTIYSRRSGLHVLALLIWMTANRR